MTHSPAVFDGYSPEAVTQSPLLGLAPVSDCSETKLVQCLNVNLDTGAHCRTNRNFTNINALRRSGFDLVQLLNEGLDVRKKLFNFEGSTTDRSVNDTGFVSTELNLTGLSVLNSLSNVRCNSTELSGSALSRAGRGSDLTDRQHALLRVQQSQRRNPSCRL